MEVSLADHLTRIAAEVEVAALTDQEFVDRLFLLVLRRRPDPHTRQGLLTDLAESKISRAGLAAGLVESREFALLRKIDDQAAIGAWGRRRRLPLRKLTGPPDTDERQVEIPWVLSRYRGERRLLDVGFAFAHPVYVRELVGLGADEVVGVDRVRADVVGLTAVAADLRALPFERGAFDLAFCVSTLEHIGWDNTVYGLEDEHDESGIAVALAELRRVLVRGGRLLLTVPCGRLEHHGWFVQLPPAEWKRLFQAAGFAVHEQEVYELSPEGWHAVPADAAADARYGAVGPGASALLCVELRPLGPVTFARAKLAPARHLVLRVRARAAARDASGRSEGFRASARASGV